MNPVPRRKRLKSSNALERVRVEAETSAGATATTLRCCIGCMAPLFHALLLIATSCSAAEIEGVVVHVADGDTITVLDSERVRHKVRLSGIDAPERSQPFGAQATLHLSALLHGKPVLVSWHKRDRYRRIIGRVLVADRECSVSACIYRQDAGLEQLSSGYAWHYKQYQAGQAPRQRAVYALAEQRAQEQHQGLWEAPHPMPPWEFRRDHRSHGARVAGYEG